MNKKNPRVHDTRMEKRISYTGVVYHSSILWAEITDLDEKYY